jgi:hypothetical protein
LPNYIAAGYITPLEGNFIAKLLALTIFLEVVMEEATNVYGSAESICQSIKTV